MVFRIHYGPACSLANQWETSDNKLTVRKRTHVFNPNECFPSESHRQLNSVTVQCIVRALLVIFALFLSRSLTNYCRIVMERFVWLFSLLLVAVFICTAKQAFANNSGNDVDMQEADSPCSSALGSAPPTNLSVLTQLHV